jgi:hypothetical protein
MESGRTSRLLTLLLRVGAGVMLVALVAVVMPRSCMVSTHQWLGLGAFPDQVIAEYLARSLSGMYAILGGFCWLFSTDVRRYRACIRFLGWIAVAGGLSLCFMDFRIGMPVSWCVGDGLFPTVFGVLLLLLSRGVPSQTE